MRLWDNEIWNKPMRNAIYWYTVANDPSREFNTGIVSAQTAMETLAWTKLVTDEQIFDEKEYKSSPASKQFCRLFSSLEIPTGIADKLLGKFKEALKINELQNVFHAFTKIRNLIIHPKPENKASLDNPRIFEGWKLGMWFLEMILLRLCDYKGKYLNKLAPQGENDLELIPWESEQKKD